MRYELADYEWGADHFRSAPSKPTSSETFGMSQTGQRTNPLARERAARGAEFVATTEDAVEMR
jgi:hypothetical protein